MTDTQKAKILKLKREGLSAAIISTRIGFPVWTIHNFIRKNKEKTE